MWDDKKGGIILNYTKINEYDVANGPGVRVSVWVSGCTLKCPGCHNKDSQNFCCGNKWWSGSMEKLKKALSPNFIKGITLTGGHPLEYENLPDVYDIVKMVKEEFPHLDIWLYTGYTLVAKDFDNNVDIGWDNAALRNHILAMCDVVVDGPYIQEERDITLAWRGSRNQRVIDVKKTKENGEIILFCD